MFESEGHLRSVVHETRDLMRVHVTNHIVAAKVGDMNPLVRIRIPRSALGSRLAIGVVARSPTNGNGDAIRESHGESVIDGMRFKIDAREGIGDGVVLVRHACIIPQMGVLVKPILCCRMRPCGVSRKHHTQLEGKAHSLAHTSHRNSRKWFD